MTFFDFVNCMAYLATAINKPLSEKAHEVYFDMLGDLPLEVLRVACKRVASTHKWATFPTVAELREAAAETMQGQITDVSPGEAWSMAWRAIGRIDPEQAGSVDRATSHLPARVVEAMTALGIPALCYGKEPVAVIRGQFLKIYEQMLNRDKRAALLPAPLKKQIAEIGRVPVNVAQIGVVPE